MEKKTRKSKKELTDSIISEIVEKNKKVPVKKLTKTLGKIRKMKSTKIQSFEDNLSDWLQNPVTPKEAYSTIDTVESYFQHPAINNSLLKMLSNPYWIRWKEENPNSEDDEKIHFRVGSAIDCLLTDPDSFEKQFYIANVSRPGGLMGVFIDNLPNGLSQESDIELFRPAWIKSKYKSKLETIVSNLFNKPLCLDYYKAKEKCDGKSILSSENYEEVSNAVKNILKNKLLAFYFVNKYDEGKNIERLFQKAIYFDYKVETDNSFTVINCKGLLDMIIIDHDNKTIIPCDLKSTATSVYDFEKNFYTYAYFRQCAFYHMAIQWWLQKEAPDTIKNYKVLPFKFIVTPKSDNGYPAIIYEVSEETLSKGLDGVYYNGKFYPGLIKLLSDYAWHKEMNFWDVPRDIYESNYTKIL